MLQNVLARAGKIKASVGSSKEARNSFDGSNETCWTVDLGTPSTSASVELTAMLDEPINTARLCDLSCTFAGGFAPVCVTVEVAHGIPMIDRWESVDTFYPADTNKQQKFAYVGPKAYAQLTRRLQVGAVPVAHTTGIRVRLEGSTDGYGRITVYDLAVMAEEE